MFSKKIIVLSSHVMPAILMLVLLVSCAQRGDDFFDAERFEAAADLYIHAAEQGDVDKMLRLAGMYAAGKIAYHRDYEQAVYWYQKAAAAAAVEAMFELGFIFEFGAGDVKQDYQRAVHWYQQAADHGHSYGQYRLATVLARQLNDYAGADAVVAYRWFLIGADSAKNCSAEPMCQIVIDDLFNYQWQLQTHLSEQQQMLARQQVSLWLAPEQK